MSQRCQYAISPFSKSGSTRIWGYKEGQPIFVCPDTKALFFDRQSIEPNSYNGYYPYLDSFNDQRFEWEYGIRVRNYRKQLAEMRKYAPGTTLVDIGAGPGYFCRAGMDAGWIAYGIEVSEQAKKYGAEKFGVEYRKLSDFADGSVDVVTCHHVIEHLFEPMALLEEMRAKLRSSGLLVIHVPHQQPLTFQFKDALAKLLGKEYGSHCSLYGNEHVSGFTQESLKLVLERAGFESYMTKSADMWTKYYDPFFLKSYWLGKEYFSLVKKTARHMIDSLAIPFGCADWVVGYFYKPA